MAWKTKVMWVPGSIGNPHNEIVHAEADKRKREGKTDGLFEVEMNENDHLNNGFPNHPIVTRTWTTLEAAEEWRDYLMQWEPKAPKGAPFFVKIEQAD